MHKKIFNKVRIYMENFIASTLVQNENIISVSNIRIIQTYLNIIQVF